MVKIDWNFDDEEYSSDYNELLELFNGNEQFSLSVHKNNWDDFEDFIISNGIKVNRKGVKSFRRYKDQCDERIYFFVKNKIKDTDHYKFTYFRDEGFNENGGMEYFKQNPTYKYLYYFDTNELINLEDERNRLEF